MLLLQVRVVKCTGNLKIKNLELIIVGVYLRVHLLGRNVNAVVSFKKNKHSGERSRKIQILI